jgi:hypothetical protein
VERRTVRRAAAGVAALLVAAGAPAGAAAAAPDAVLYEVSEAVVRPGPAASRESTATLVGALRRGAPLCPDAVAAASHPRGCWLSVRARSRVDGAGVGPVEGTFEVLVQDDNPVDAPEIVVARGTLAGVIDLSPSVRAGVPRGTIRGRFAAAGAAGAFAGTFRLPFLHGGRPSYLMDDGAVVAAEADERSLGVPTVRLELSLSP